VYELDEDGHLDLVPMNFRGRTEEAGFLEGSVLASQTPYVHQFNSCLKVTTSGKGC